MSNEDQFNLEEYNQDPEDKKDPPATQQDLTATMAQAITDAAASINAAGKSTAIKLPPVWTDSLEIYFLQIEAMFDTANIKADNKKYNHLVQALDKNIAKRLLQALRKPPEGDKYKQLKGLILRVFSLTEFERSERLLNIQLGDLTPAELMDEMLSFYPHDKDPDEDFLFRSLFIRQMPQHIKNHLVANTIQKAEELSSEAGKLFVVAPLSNFNMEEPAVDALRQKFRPKRKLRPEGQKQLQHQQQSSPSDFCWYHTRFGDKAKFCQSPCKFPDQGNANTGRQ